jgi:hypothetical protein
MARLYSGNIASRIRVGDMYYYGRGVRQNFDVCHVERHAVTFLKLVSETTRVLD